MVSYMSFQKHDNLLDGFVAQAQSVVAHAAVLIDTARGTKLEVRDVSSNNPQNPSLVSLTLCQARTGFAARIVGRWQKVAKIKFWGNGSVVPNEVFFRVYQPNKDAGGFGVLDTISDIFNSRVIAEKPNTVPFELSKVIADGILRNSNGDRARLKLPRPVREATRLNS